MGTLCVILLLQFYADSFETSQVFWSWSKDLHVVWIIILRLYFVTFLSNLNLVFFQALLLSTYVDSMYLARVTPPINFTFSDDSLFL